MTEQSPEPKPRDRRAFNAYRHGLTGHVLVIEPNDEQAYKQHCQGIHQSFAPSGAMETDLVQSIADDRWRLKRAAAIESNIFALGLSEPDQVTADHDEVDTALAMARVWLERGKELDRLTLYESRIQRHIEKNMALLRQMQQDRRNALQQAAREAALLSQLAAAKGETCDFPMESLPPQFDFSSDLISRLAAHHHRLSEAQKQFSETRQALRRAA
jgi:hypothetical protein